MKSVRTLVGLLAVTAVVFGGWLGAQTKPGADPVKDPAVDPVARGQLRPGWEKLGLTDDQAQKVFQVQADYRVKIEALEQQLKALKDEQHAKEVGVLTEAQKKRLGEELEAARSDDKTDPNKP